MHTQQKTHWREECKSSYFSSLNPSICKMASPPAHNVLAFIFSIYCQYLKAIRTPGESTRKKWVEKYIFNIKGKEERYISNRKVECGPFFSFLDFKCLFLKGWIPFSVSLPFYATASGQIFWVLLHRQDSTIIFWLPKEPVLVEWPQIQASATFGNAAEWQVVRRPDIPRRTQSAPWWQPPFLNVL